MRKREIAYACLYLSYAQILAPYNFEERGRLMTAMLDYAATGTVPEFAGNERFIWPTLQSQIDRDKEDYEKRCEANRTNGKKGGRKKNPSDEEKTQKTDGLSSEPQKANDNDNDKDKDNDSDKDNDNAIEKDNERQRGKEKGFEAAKPPARPRFSPPGVDDVRKYCQQGGFQVNPERFVNHYTANGWRVGKAPMEDWKAAVRNWNDRDREGPPGSKRQSFEEAAAAQFGRIGLRL